MSERYTAKRIHRYGRTILCISASRGRMYCSRGTFPKILSSSTSFVKIRVLVLSVSQVSVVIYEVSKRKSFDNTIMLDEHSFVTAVRTWVQVDDFIKEAMIAIREKKEERKRLEQEILDFMKASEQDELALNTGGLLRRTVTKTKASLKEEYLHKTLSRFIDTSEAASVVQAIMKERPLTEKEHLRRSVPRGMKK